MIGTIVKVTVDRPLRSYHSEYSVSIPPQGTSTFATLFLHALLSTPTASPAP